LHYVTDTDVGPAVNRRNGLPDRIRDTRSTWPLPKVDFRHYYDAAANLVTRADDSDGPNETRSMDYDGLNRLTYTDAPGLLGYATYSYDVLDNLRSVNYAGFQRVPQLHTYSYDPTSHRLSQIHMTDGACNVYLPYGYDARGNATSRSVPQDCGTTPHSHIFDRVNRMTSSQVNGQWENYWYDGHGRRALVQRNSTTTHYLYDRDGVLRYERRPDGVGIRHVHLGKRLVASLTGTVPAYTHTDALGSVVRRTDAFGNQLPDAQGGRASIEPYGSLSAGAWLQGQPGFTGHVADCTTCSSATMTRSRCASSASTRSRPAPPTAATSTGTGTPTTIRIPTPIQTA
jgi:hypothetical protein